MTTVTDEQIAEWQQLADRSSRGSWQWKLAREAVSALLIEVRRLRADQDALRLCASLLVEWRRTPFFETRDEWEKWTSDFGVRVDAALHALLDADVAHLQALTAVPAPPQADDRLAWAEAGAREMQRECVKHAKRKPQKGERFSAEQGRLIALELSALDPAAVAQRAVDAEDAG